MRDRVALFTRPAANRAPSHASINDQEGGPEAQRHEGERHLNGECVMAA
jgi:hypothetical protein